jgi:hypothetical protein
MNIISARWGLSTGGTGQPFLDLTTDAQAKYNRGVRTFEPNDAFWDNKDPAKGKTKTLLMVWQGDEVDAPQCGAAVREHTDQKITLV